MNNKFNYHERNEKGLTYTVKPGDSLYKIANMFQTSVDSLMRINKLQNAVLTIGQILQITNFFPTPAHIGEDICGDGIEDDTPLENDKKYQLYTVKSGDSLYKISHSFHTNIPNILYINNLKNDVLMIGQVLKIPITNSNPIIHIVKKGDSLWGIAKQYSVTVQQLKTANSLSNETLSINQSIIIPASVTESPNQENVYIVKSGDSLWSISQKLKISTAFLIEKNGLKNSILSIGQKLVIR